VRHDPLAEKDERANVQETLASVASFDSFEKKAVK